jgi:hypothetical protein
VGTGGTGFVTVIGFGSIVTDVGDTYSSATGTYSTNTTPSVLTSSTTLGIGQQLEIVYDTSGNPTTVMSAPTLIGAVASITTTTGMITAGTPSSGTVTSFVVNNLPVKVNTTLSQGPITYFVGYANANAMTVADQAEVHGFYAVDTNGPYIQATRVVLLPSSNTLTRTVGVVSSYSSGTFNLGATAVTTTGASILPTGTALANSQYVSVLSNTAMVSNTIAANVVRVRQITSAMNAIKVAGLVYNISGSSFSVSGISVDGSATALSSTVSGLSNGTYVVITGSANSSGVLVASGITASNSGTVALKGTITNFVNSSSFQVRGTLVNASAVSTSITNNLANGVYVNIVGTVSGNSVLPMLSAVNSGVTILTAPQSSTVEYVGTITAVNGSSSFTISAQNGSSYTFNLATNVGYESAGSTACTLTTGARVNVEATLSGSTYIAYGIQCLLASGTNAPSGTSEVAGVVSNVTTTGSGYSFEVNNVQVSGTGTLPSSFVNGANVDVHINNTNTNTSTVSSNSVPHVDD